MNDCLIFFNSLKKILALLFLWTASRRNEVNEYALMYLKLLMVFKHTALLCRATQWKMGRQELKLHNRVKESQICHGLFGYVKCLVEKKILQWVHSFQNLESGNTEWLLYNEAFLHWLLVTEMLHALGKTFRKCGKTQERKGR